MAVWLDAKHICYILVCKLQGDDSPNYWHFQYISLDKVKSL